MLAPHELKKNTFSKTVRGYNPIEVDEYIEFLVEKYTEIYRENIELEKKLKSVAAKLDQIRDEEESIRTTLLNAQKMAERIVSDANSRATMITDSIKERSDTIVAQFRSEIDAEKDEMWEIRTRILDFKKRVFDMYREHIESLQSLSVNEIEDIVLPDDDKLIAGIFSDVKSAVKAESKPEETAKTMPTIEMDKVRERPAQETEQKAEEPEENPAEEEQPAEESKGGDKFVELFKSTGEDEDKK